VFECQRAPGAGRSHPRGHPDERGRCPASHTDRGARALEPQLQPHGDQLTRRHADIAGSRIADAGTGAGFPGLPLAVCNPQRHFTLIDSTAKKVRFVAHAVSLLELTNVSTVHARIESLKLTAPFDTVLARAFAPIPELLEKVAPLCGPETRVLAMKGKWPREELAALEAPWRVVSSRELTVPGLDAARCVIVLARSAGAARAAPEV